MTTPDIESRENHLRKELRQLDAEYNLASGTRKREIDLRRNEINREYESLIREKSQQRGL